MIRFVILVLLAYLLCTEQQNMSCSFEDGLCGWDLRTFSPLKWTRTNQMNITFSEPLKGPGRDHSTNTITGMCRPILARLL